MILRKKNLMTVKTVEYLPTIESEVVGLDIETNWTDKTKDGANPYVDKIVSITISEPNGNVWLMENNFTAAIPLLIQPNQKKIIHNAIYDLQFLNHHLGISTRNVWDSLIVERVINTGDSSKANDLASVLARRLGITLDKSIRSQFANHTGPMTSEQKKYAGEDVAYLIPLRESQLKDISNQQLGKVVALENAFVHALVKASLDGVGFDQELWDQQQRQISKEVRIREKAITDLLGLGYQYDIFGETILDINLGSTKQLQKLIKDKFDIEIGSTSEEELLDWTNHPNKDLAAFIKLLLEYKEWLKRQQWHFNDYVHPITGRIHANWNQLKVTGRMGCSDPNLQQIPNPLKGNPGDPNFRLLFPPDLLGEYVYIVSDFSKQEPGILAHISQDENLIAAYNSGDIYVEMAKIAYETSEISERQRYDVKQGLLSAYYGAGIPKLADRMGISEEIATDFKARMRKAGPKAARWSDSQESLLKRRGFSETLSGRRIYFPQLMRERFDPSAYLDKKSYYNKSINYPIQGTAADMFKLGAVHFYNHMAANPSYDAAANIFVHDELVVRVKREQAQEVYFHVIAAMEKAASDLCPSVHIKADAHINDRWEKK
jgi:DNA polymerase I